MPRYTRYLSLEKHIAASDTGGILERWRYGRELVTDRKRTTDAGNLRNGVLAELLGIARKAEVTLSEREIQYRLKAAKAYPSEAESRSAAAEYGSWRSLCDAGFPQVQVADPGEPYDPRDADEKWRDFRNEQERRKKENPHQPVLEGLELPDYFSHDTFGPRTQLADLGTYCDERERMTANYVKRDSEIRAYYDELLTAAGGNVRMTWIEAEVRRRGLDAFGLSDWSELDQILSEWSSRPEPPADDLYDDE